jgi:lysozyme
MIIGRMALEGIDVSHNNGVVSWSRVRAAGIGFAFIKASEGTTFTDPAWATNIAGCRARGISAGSYHFYHHDADPTSQAEHFVRVIGKLEEGDLTPALDVEGPGDGAGAITYPQAEVITRIAVFVEAVERALGRSPLIYTYPAVWQEITGNSSAFATRCPLWIASYAQAPLIPGDWTGYSVWQYTDRGRVDGVATIVDRDRATAHESGLEALGIRICAVGGLATIKQDANVRAAPGLTAAVIRVLPRGTGVVLVGGPEFVKDRQWWQIDDGEGTVGWCSGKLLTPV